MASTSGATMQIDDDPLWNTDLTTHYSFSPVLRPDMTNLTNRARVYKLFRNFYDAVQTDTPVIDLNVAFLEDAIVTCLGKLDASAHPFTIRFEARKAVKMSIGIQSTEETDSLMPVKKYNNNAIEVKNISKRLFTSFFNAISVIFSIKVRRHLEMILSPLIVRVSRRQDVLFNKPAQITMGGGRVMNLASHYTPLFRGCQTYKRFLPLISNHCGIGVKLQLMLTSDTTNMPKSKLRVTKQLTHQEQKDVVELMSTSTTGVTADWINLFLQSCYLFRPKEGLSFVTSFMYTATNSDAAIAAYNTFYKEARSVMCGTVPYWFVELMVMTGAYYDDLGIFEIMTGHYFSRKDFSLTNNLSLMTPAGGDIILTALKPLKGSASSHPGSSKQQNTIVSVHGRRIVHDNFKWMNVGVMWAAHSDAFMKLRQITERAITDQAQGIEVCSFDSTDLALTIRGFWND